MLWQTKVPPEANLLLKCGDIGLMHDKRTVLFAFDPSNGKRLATQGRLWKPYDTSMGWKNN